MKYQTLQQFLLCMIIIIFISWLSFYMIEEGFANTKPRIALLLRGHIRKTFDNQQLYTFINKLRQKYRVDIYLTTWNNIETLNSYRFNNKPDNKTSRKLINKYFKDIPIRSIRIHSGEHHNN